jgi:hypothetical protein
MAEPENRVETPASPFVIFEAALVDLRGYFIGKQVEQPEEE